jgi:hypothetical protein
MTNWLHGSNELVTLDQFPEGCIGFVYKITNLENDKIYVGKKILHNTLTKKLTIKEREAWNKPGKIPTKRKEVKESDWAKYYGSCKPLLADLKYFGPPSFTREILEFCYTKKQLSYYEVKWQMLLNVLENDSYNENIQGKWFKRDTKQLIESQYVITD